MLKSDALNGLIPTGFNLFCIFSCESILFLNKIMYLCTYFDHAIL